MAIFFTEIGNPAWQRAMVKDCWTGLPTGPKICPISSILPHQSNKWVQFFGIVRLWNWPVFLASRRGWSDPALATAKDKVVTPTYNDLESSQGCWAEFLQSSNSKKLLPRASSPSNVCTMPGSFHFRHDLGVQHIPST